MNTDTPLKRARISKSLSQKQAAIKVGIDQGQWSRIERGLQYPSRDLLRRIVAEFDVTVDAVLFPSEKSAA